MRDDADVPAAPRPEPVRRVPLWRRILGNPWTQLLIAFTVTGLVLSLVAKPYLVPSSSMEDTLQPGDRVLVNRLAYVGAPPGVGDIVVFDADASWSTAEPEDRGLFASVLAWLGQVTGFGASGPHTLVKRIIGTPGQTVECCSDDGAVMVDGEPLDEPYVSSDFAFDPGVVDCTTLPQSDRCFRPIVVPPGSYLVLGDNRAISSDSAALCRVDASSEDCWRWATREGIVGKTVFILWPPGRWGVP